MMICKASTLFLSRFACRHVWVLLLLLGLLLPAQAAEALKPDALPLPKARAALERLEQQFAAAQTATAQELKTLKKDIATNLPSSSPQSIKTRRRKRQERPNPQNNRKRRLLPPSPGSCRICRARKIAWKDISTSANCCC